METKKIFLFTIPEKITQLCIEKYQGGFIYACSTSSLTYVTLK